LQDRRSTGRLWYLTSHHSENQPELNLLFSKWLRIGIWVMSSGCLDATSGSPIRNLGHHFDRRFPSDFAKW
jgi:hypothetical protein